MPVQNHNLHTIGIPTLLRVRNSSNHSPFTGTDPIAGENQALEQAQAPDRVGTFSALIVRLPLSSASTNMYIPAGIWFTFISLPPCLKLPL